MNKLLKTRAVRAYSMALLSTAAFASACTQGTTVPAGSETEAAKPLEGKPSDPKLVKNEDLKPAEGQAPAGEGAAAQPPAGEGAPAAGAAGAPGAAGAAPAAAGDKSALTNPGAATAKAPDKYTVKLETTAGDILIDVTREWAPIGADRFYNLVKIGYFSDVSFFRVIPGFMAQVGISGAPDVAAAWDTPQARIKDDAVKQSNKTGYVTFATAGPETRTTQFFINFADNTQLDGQGFAPFGKVRDMAPVNKLNGEYGEGAPRGKGPLQGKIKTDGNKYLKAEFPKLDYIKQATVVEEGAG